MPLHSSNLLQGGRGPRPSVQEKYKYNGTFFNTFQKPHDNDDDKGSLHSPIVQFFLTLFKRPLTPLLLPRFERWKFF